MKKKIDKEEKQEKIKRILKIVGCSTGLFLCGGAFIGLLFVGVRGCSSTPRSNNKSVSDSALVDSTINQRKAAPQQSFKPVDIGGYNYYPYVLGGYNTFGNEPNIITTSINKEYSIQTIINGVTRSKFGVVSTMLGQIRVNNFAFYNLDNWGDTTQEVSIRYQVTNSISESFIDINVGDFIYFNTNDLDRYTNDNNVKWLFDNNILRPYEDVNITFNNIINPFGPLGNNYDIIYKNSVSGSKLLFKGLFTDLTGEMYKSITLWYLSANGYSYGTASNYNDYTGDGSYFLALYYVKLNGDEIYVNGQDFATATGGSHKGSPILIASNHWISSMFQSIHILTIEDDNNYLTPDYDRLVALTSLNNNVNGSAIYNDGATIGGTNPFVLIGSAFSSLIPFLTITIVPGITIGTLLLVPLVGMIVLFVVFLFKR